jgi:hypothetical protein
VCNQFAGHIKWLASAKRKKFSRFTIFCSRVCSELPLSAWKPNELDGQQKIGLVDPSTFPYARRSSAGAGAVGPSSDWMLMLHPSEQPVDPLALDFCVIY